MQIFLAVTPQELRSAMQWRCGLAHVAYRIGPESTLLRQNLLLDTRGGLLSLSDQDAPMIGDPEKLSSAIIRECSRRNYGGALLDFELPASQDRQAFVAELDRVMSRNRRALYVPEPYGKSAPGGAVLLCTAMSGGNFTERLREAISLRGVGHVALDLQRLRMDFSLPAPSGAGKPLTGEALTALLDRAPAVFFSQDLCARYFTYTRESDTHFILYDDADTLLQKIRIGSSLGIGTAFLMYPEVQDLLPKLFRANGNR